MPDFGASILQTLNPFESTWNGLDMGAIGEELHEITRPTRDSVEDSIGARKLLESARKTFDAMRKGLPETHESAGRIAHFRRFAHSELGLDVAKLLDGLGVAGTTSHGKTADTLVRKAGWSLIQVAQGMTILSQDTSVLASLASPITDPVSKAIDSVLPSFGRGPLEYTGDQTSLVSCRVDDAYTVQARMNDHLERASYMLTAAEVVLEAESDGGTTVRTLRETYTEA